MVTCLVLRGSTLGPFPCLILKLDTRCVLAMPSVNII